MTASREENCKAGEEGWEREILFSVYHFVSLHVLSNHNQSINNMK